jgi:hypothetical protein
VALSISTKTLPSVWLLAHPKVTLPTFTLGHCLMPKQVDTGFDDLPILPASPVNERS